MVEAYLRDMHAQRGQCTVLDAVQMGNRSCNAEAKLLEPKATDRGRDALDCTPPQDNIVYCGLRLTVADCSMLCDHKFYAYTT
jgi:hypothetical protein